MPSAQRARGSARNQAAPPKGPAGKGSPVRAGPAGAAVGPLSPELSPERTLGVLPAQLRGRRASLGTRRAHGGLTGTGSPLLSPPCSERTGAGSISGWPPSAALGTVSSDPGQGSPRPRCARVDAWMDDGWITGGRTGGWAGGRVDGMRVDGEAAVGADARANRPEPGPGMEQDSRGHGPDRAQLPVCASSSGSSAHPCRVPCPL